MPNRKRRSPRLPLLLNRSKLSLRKEGSFVASPFFVYAYKFFVPAYVSTWKEAQLLHLSIKKERKEEVFLQSPF